ncbi:Peroxidase [Rhynchospora pubera]|uniref:Peroxidase n=1 Tax=Rhynchospora pubera TaxID=906938 RepID=A0AAV8HFB8_9POAL|nr:Peroxidase [Rhynchospora pubera]
MIQIILSVILVLYPYRAASLSTNYYANICPNLENLVRGAVQQQMAQSPITAPATLRLFFHDCFVNGCDASIMIINPNGDDEWHHPDDFTLKPDGFFTVLRAKAAVDADPRCTNKVSCADILALAARDSVLLSGGPYWPVELGRYDGKVSTRNSVVLPHPDYSLDKLYQMFSAFGLDQTDLVALSGGHTFGAASCAFINNRLYPTTDQTMNPQFANQLRGTCPAALNPNIFVFLDATTFAAFDNAYYKNLQQGKGLLASDQILYNDPRTQGTVNMFASNQGAFFQAFTNAMTKLGRIQVKSALNGEIRRDCRFPN